MGNLSKGLKSFFSTFSEYKEYTKEQWAQFVIKETPALVEYLNIIFESAPVLKGEFPVSWTPETGMILTNYRLFYNSTVGLHIIPLKDLISYGQTADVIQYKKQGETLSIEFPGYWMHPDIVQNVSVAKEFENLDDIQNSLLSMSFYDFEKNNLTAPKIVYLVAEELSPTPVPPRSRWTSGDASASGRARLPKLQVSIEKLGGKFKLKKVPTKTVIFAAVVLIAAGLSQMLFDEEMVKKETQEAGEEKPMSSTATVQSISNCSSVSSSDACSLIGITSAPAPSNSALT